MNIDPYPTVMQELIFFSISIKFHTEEINDLPTFPHKLPSSLAIMKDGFSEE